MKKLLLLSALAAAAASCATVEVADREVKDQEIKFNVAPVTKAEPSFSTTNVFKSWAWYLPKNSTWDSKNGVVPTEYINGETIKYVAPKWKADKSYNWPKDGGALTFFAYSLNSSNLTLTSGADVTCTAADGIKVTGYDAKTDKNVDFLVADIQKDQTANRTNDRWDGVPTIFRHKLSSLGFSIKLTDADKLADKFTLKSISLKNVKYKGEYVQTAEEKWTPAADVTAFSYYSDETGQIFTSTSEPVEGDYTFYLPQEFTKSGADVSDSDPLVEIVYTVKTGNTERTITAKHALKDVFSDNWKIGKKYTCEISMALDEILWAPSVSDWEPASGNTITIE